MYLAHVQHPVHPAVRAWRAIIIIALLALFNQATAGSVDARLSAQSVGAGQPAELILTATSDGAGQPLSPPDLSVLEDSFRVLDRQTQRRVRITSGRRREQVTLRLLLMPRHTGRLQIPAIPFGPIKSAPLTLTVQAGEVADNKGLDQPLPANPTDAFTTSDTMPGAADVVNGDDAAELGQPPWIMTGPDRGMQSSWATQWPTAPWPGSPFSPPLGDTEMQPLDPPRFDLPQQTREETPASKAGANTNQGSDPWFWVSLILAAALAVSLIKRRTPTAPATRRPAGREPELPRDPLAPAVARIRESYRRADAAAARDALLAWGKLRWPENPPNNLSRLAQRMEPPLRDHVTDLEKAFFSPEPIQWDLEPVADELTRLGRGGPRGV